MSMHPLWPHGKPTLYDQPIFWPRFYGQRSLIDPLRPFMRSRNYAWRGFAFPDTGREQFAARQALEDQVQLTPGSFLLIISAQSGAFPNDFMFDITDKGSGKSLSNSYLRYMAATGGPGGVKFPNRPLPLILPAPFAVTDPGILMIRITNLATTTNAIRLFLQFAQPRGIKRK